MKVEKRIEVALELLDAGFNSKAAQKKAIDAINRAYEDLNDAINEKAKEAAYAVQPSRESEEENKAWCEAFDKYEVPMNLHQVRARHIEAVRDLDEDFANKIVLMIETLEAVKAEEINPIERKEPSPYQVKAEQTLKELIEKRKAQYIKAVELGRIFEGLPVSANSHLVVNQHGTEFIRTFYYLADKITPLNVIIAAAQTLAEENN